MPSCCNVVRSLSADDQPLVIESTRGAAPNEAPQGRRQAAATIQRATSGCESPCSRTAPPGHASSLAVIDASARLAVSPEVAGDSVARRVQALPLLETAELARGAPRACARGQARALGAGLVFATLHASTGIDAASGTALLLEGTHHASARIRAGTITADRAFGALDQLALRGWGGGCGARLCLASSQGRRITECAAPRAAVTGAGHGRSRRRWVRSFPIPPGLRG